jgi:hypothetical protein
MAETGKRKGTPKKKPLTAAQKASLKAKNIKRLTKVRPTKEVLSRGAAEKRKAAVAKREADFLEWKKRHANDINNAAVRLGALPSKNKKDDDQSDARAKVQTAPACPTGYEITVHMVDQAIPSKESRRVFYKVDKNGKKRKYSVAVEGGDYKTETIPRFTCQAINISDETIAKRQKRASVIRVLEPQLTERQVALREKEFDLGKTLQDTKRGAASPEPRLKKPVKRSLAPYKKEAQRRLAVRQQRAKKLSRGESDDIEAATDEEEGAD